MSILLQSVRTSSRKITNAEPIASHKRPAELAREIRDIIEGIDALIGPAQKAETATIQTGDVDRAWHLAFGLASEGIDATAPASYTPDEADAFRQGLEAGKARYVAGLMECADRGGVDVEAIHQREEWNEARCRPVSVWGDEDRYSDQHAEAFLSCMAR